MKPMCTYGGTVCMDGGKRNWVCFFFFCPLVCVCACARGSEGKPALSAAHISQPGFYNWKCRVIKLVNARDVAWTES